MELAFFVWGVAVGILVANRHGGVLPMTGGQRLALGIALTLALLVGWYGLRPARADPACARLPAVCERAPELCAELQSACG